jgi:hypothetical protein
LPLLPPVQVCQFVRLHEVRMHALLSSLNRRKRRKRRISFCLDGPEIRATQRSRLHAERDHVLCFIVSLGQVSSNRSSRPACPRPKSGGSLRPVHEWNRRKNCASRSHVSVGLALLEAPYDRSILVQASRSAFAASCYSTVKVSLIRGAYSPCIPRTLAGRLDSALLTFRLVVIPTAALGFPSHS